MKNNVGRKLIKSTDVFIILIIIVLCVGFMFIFGAQKDSKATAVISIGGKVYERVELGTCEDKTIKLKTTPEVTLEIKNHQIRFINSHCPDKTCEKSGFLSSPGDTAACVPAKVVVTIVGEKKQDVDIIVG